MSRPSLCCRCGWPIFDCACPGYSTGRGAEPERETEDGTEPLELDFGDDDGGSYGELGGEA